MFDPRFPLANQIHEKLNALAKTQTGAEKDAARAESRVKAIHAELINHYLGGMSRGVAAAENLATADQRFAEATEAAIEARSAANLASAMYWNAKAGLDVMRSEMALRRTEIERLSMVS